MSFPLPQNEALDQKPAILILVERFPDLQPLAGELNTYKGTLPSFYEGGHTNKQTNKFIRWPRDVHLVLMEFSVRYILLLNKEGTLMTNGS